MQTHHLVRLPGLKFSQPLKAMLSSSIISLILVASMAGQTAPAHDEKATVSPEPEPLLARVMEDLPRFGENPAPAADFKSSVEVSTETVHLAPLVVVAGKRIKLLSSETLTQKAFAAEIFKRYNFSAFSAFQHREDVRLDDMAELQNYASNLMLTGDREEGRAIKKEVSRLFLPPHDPESDYIVSVFNPRIR